jgi:hypothetical protein
MVRASRVVRNPPGNRAASTAYLEDRLARPQVGGVDERSYDFAIAALHPLLEKWHESQECTTHRDRAVLLGQNSHEVIPLRPGEIQRQQYERGAVASHLVADPGVLTLTRWYADRRHRIVSRHSPRQLSMANPISAWRSDTALDQSVSA